MGVVPAKLHVGPPRPLLEPGLGHLQRVLLVPQRPFQGIDQHLCLEDLLQGLRTGKKEKNEEGDKVSVGPQPSVPSQRTQYKESHFGGGLKKGGGS